MVFGSSIVLHLGGRARPPSSMRFVIQRMRYLLSRPTPRKSSVIFSSRWCRLVMGSQDYRQSALRRWQYCPSTSGGALVRSSCGRVSTRVGSRGMAWLWLSVTRRSTWKFGFVPASTKGLAYELSVPPEAFMVLELHARALTRARGMVRYRPEFTKVSEPTRRRRHMGRWPCYDPAMRTKTLWTAAAFVFLARALFAQDLAGDWQGALGSGAQQLRLIVHIDKARGQATWKASLLSIDQSPDRGARMAADSVFGGRHQLQDDGDGESAAPTKARSPRTATRSPAPGARALPLPLTLVRATPATAWKDPSPHTVSFVTAEPDVKLEVLDWGGPRLAGRSCSCRVSATPRTSSTCSRRN